jgi:hypothetical protein
LDRWFDEMGKGFEDLEVYQEARVLRRRVWKLTTLLPREAKLVLESQMRRASLSATNCIAEGHGSRSYRHNISYASCRMTSAPARMKVILRRNTCKTCGNRLRRSPS